VQVLNGWRALCGRGPLDLSFISGYLACSKPKEGYPRVNPFMNSTSFSKLLAILLVTATGYLSTPLQAAGGSGDDPIKRSMRADGNSPITASAAQSGRSARGGSVITGPVNYGEVAFGQGIWESGYAGLAVPTAFQPTAGQALVIPGIEQFPDNRIFIFDSSGRRVFSQRGYANTWQGTDRSGTPLGPGTFFVIVEIEGLGDDVQAYVRVH
jgi:hypothetical protein